MLSIALPAAAQRAAEIVSLKGKGEYREAEKPDWRPARVTQVLDLGQFVRTIQPESKMSVLLVNQTLLTIEGIAMMQMKPPETAAPRKSILEFNKGTARFQTKTPSKDFEVRTPTGVAAIRGTEWLLEVDDDGRSAFTVVEGEIEISNELGTLGVGASEEGVLEKGKAPFKRRVQNPRERIQWVGAFTIDPLRYAELRSATPEASRLAAAVAALNAHEIVRARELLAANPDTAVAHFLLADIDMYFGRGPQAIEWLAKAAQRFPSEGRTDGLLARAYLFVDDFERAREAASRAVSRHPDTLESQLAAGEVARLDGDYRAARAARAKATRIAPDDWRAWHALGQVYADRADPRRARRALGRADQLSRDNAQVLGEMGGVEANAYNLPRSREILGRALAAQPDDFATWTGMGVARLKSGDLEGALDALLKATLLEPRYARAHVYLAVVYWQQGRSQDAFAELRTAVLHDPRDPLPWQLESMMYSDLLRPGDALAAARESVARLAYVKSLDVIANNLRGAANLGAPLAQLGLESWALKNAHDSYDPFWGGSHLFLADRLTSKFAANSELVQGFITDPLAFGASNRYQTLVTRPGTYGTVGGVAVRTFGNNLPQLAQARITQPYANLSGLVADGTFAYFADAARLESRLEDRSLEENADTYTVGLGWKPRDDLGFFIAANRFLPETRSGFPGRSLFETYSLVTGKTYRVDAGAHYRPGPDLQVWIKGGHGDEDSELRARDVGRVGNVQFFGDSFLTTTPRRDDVSLRILHRYANGLELSCTAEASRFRSIDFLERDQFGRTNATQPRLLESVRQDVRDESKSFALSGRWPISRVVVAEFEADYSTYEKRNDIFVRQDFGNQRISLADNYDRDEWSPRAGIVLNPMPGVTLRAAYQKWLRPAATGSLKPASTAGIDLDDRYVREGGLLERTRAQVEWQAAPNIMVTAFTDRQDIDNLYSSLVGLANRGADLTNLDRLRNRAFRGLASLTEIEGFAELTAGWLRESGATFNMLATRQVSLFVEGIMASSENTGLQRGKKLQFLPKERYALGGTYFSDHRWFIAAKATWRGERFNDEANAERRPPEWSGFIQAYWESADKRWSLEGVLSNLGAKSAKESAGVAVTYRF
jgi:tetratricopeptide (TPR) repeat protein